MDNLVTIYITNHNYEKYIDKSIESVLSQTYDNFELIIIDDGSTDNSNKIIENYSSNPKVKIVYQENKGLNVTNNIALRLSKGKYIMRLDADDYLDENALMIMVNKLDKEQDVALVFPDYYIIDENNDIVGHERRHDFKNVTLFDQPAHGACTMIRKDVLLDHSGYSEEFGCQDGYDLWLKIFNKYKIANINLPLFYYRDHNNSLTKNKEKILSTRHEVIKKHSNNLNIKSKNNICIIPIRNTKENLLLAMKDIDGKRIIDLTIETVLKTENISKVIISTSNDEILSHVSMLFKEKILFNKRPERYEAINTHLESTINYLIENYKNELDKIDTLMVLNFEYPLRKSIFIDKAINSLFLFNADSVISVQEENYNFYRHDGNGLKPFNTNKELRLERDIVYKEIGGIHAVKYDSYKKYKKLVCGRTTHIILDELSSKKATNDFDLLFIEYLMKKYNK